MADLVDLSFAHRSLIGIIVLVQAGLLLAAVFATAVFLAGRAAVRRYVLRKRDEYDGKLIELLFDTGSEGQLIDQMPHVWPWQEQIYRDAVLNQIHVMGGPERERLVKLYVSTGLFDEDGDQLRSRAWWRRLRALIRLDILSIPECRDAFLRSLDDPHPLVALSATRALSRIGGVAPALIFSSLERVGLQHRDAMVEIIANVGSFSGPTEVCLYLETCPESELAIACVRVLGDLRAVEAMPVFMRILADAPSLSDEFLAELLDALRLILDPAAIETVRPLLLHVSPAVRAKSILFLDAFGDDESAAEIEALKADSSVEVRRALQRVESQKGAA